MLLDKRNWENKAFIFCIFEKENGSGLDKTDTDRQGGETRWKEEGKGGGTPAIINSERWYHNPPFPPSQPEGKSPLGEREKERKRKDLPRRIADGRQTKRRKGERNQFILLISPLSTAVCTFERSSLHVFAFSRNFTVLLPRQTEGKRIRNNKGKRKQWKSQKAKTSGPFPHSIWRLKFPEKTWKENQTKLKLTMYPRSELDADP